MPLHLAIAGATGKMGKRVMELAHSEDFVVKAESNRSQPLSLSDIDVVIDFSSPAATLNHLQACLSHRKPLVIGTTGHQVGEKDAIHKAAKTIPILFSPNFSLGVALTLHTVSQFAKGLKGLVRVDIVETHHVQKKDSPSGTALALADRIREHTEPEKVVVHSIRSGSVIGEHRVIFECETERIELRHEALTRDCFAKGALLAARFLAKKDPGLYSLQDLFLTK